MSRLAEVINYYKAVRRVGHTRAMIYGATTEPKALVIVANLSDANYLPIKEEQLISVSQLPEKLYGQTRPIIIDHYALVEMFYEHEKEWREHTQKLENQISRLLERD